MKTYSISARRKRRDRLLPRHLIQLDKQVKILNASWLIRSCNVLKVHYDMQANSLDINSIDMPGNFCGGSNVHMC